MDDTGLNILLTIVFYAIYAMSQRAKRAAGEPEDPSAELARVEALLADIELRGKRLGSQRRFQAVIAPLWHDVLLTKVKGLQGVAALPEEMVTPWQLGHRREQLEHLADELEHQALEAAPEPGSRVGDVLYATLEEITQEVQRVFPAYPDADVLTRGGNIDRSTLQHMYAAWAPTLFGDVASAMLDPEPVRAELHGLETGRGWISPPAEPPDFLRGVAMAAALQVPFRGHAPDDELLITSSLGHQFAMPEAVLREDIHQLATLLARRRWAALGNRTLEAVTEYETIAAPLMEAKKAAAPRPVKASTPRPATPPVAGRARKPRPTGARRSLKRRAREAIVIGEVLRL